ncbi:MAG TPA: PE domain-containing protein [Mycobacterium sp.]|nr:PE domain-containing protein [Mycobacterium sp.]
MGEPDLRVNVEELNWDSAAVTVPGVPEVPPDADPMSVMLAAIMPEIATAVTEAVAATLAREERFAANLSAAGGAYQNTDGAAQQQIQSAGASIEPASAAAGTGAAQSAGTSADQGGQLGQMMGMPMQMAGQAAQIPMQLMGMAAAIPQGIMQGVQSAMQQVGQISGMGGQGDKDSEQKEAAQLHEPTGEASNESRAVREPEPTAEAGQGDRADSGNTGGERVPEPERPQAQDVPTEPRPAPTRPADSSPENVL